MTTFDLAEVRDFAADLDAKMTRCDNGEGMECATLSDALQRYAELCCKFIDVVRQWGRAVFTGRAEFDPEVERILKEEGSRLQSRARDLCGRGQRAEGTCYTLEGARFLQAALWELDRLLNPWVSPALAVGPLARRKRPLDLAEVEEARHRVASLPPLPAEWEPADPQLRAMYRKLRTS
jgi:hypothetical protein